MLLDGCAQRPVFTDSFVNLPLILVVVVIPHLLLYLLIQKLTMISKLILIRLIYGLILTARLAQVGSM